ncbi:MAG: ergothioneine biosynthesis protein EgtB [Oleibacter sp.]|nr:ergothioneine biosynthesis protein EgtB [Thalassolituus sp.]
MTTFRSDTAILIQQFLATRLHSESLCHPLSAEDMGMQADAFVSPPKWHLAHTTWFFETFILSPLVSGYRVFHPRFEYLFNSYYNGVGEQFDRGKRGLLSRPNVDEVLKYREHVDTAMQAALQSPELFSEEDYATVCERCVLGIHHEKQHQELLLMDIRYMFFQNPLLPAYDDSHSLDASSNESASITDIRWLEVAGGLVDIGVRASDIGEGSADFYFDNESPQHSFFLNKYEIADRLVTNGEYLQFIQENGYDNPECWLADGWSHVNSEHWQHPLYWLYEKGEWYEFTLQGKQPLDLTAPVTNISGYEAAAYAHWAKARLPTEQEWENAARLYNGDGYDGNEALSNHDVSLSSSLVEDNTVALIQASDSAWQWTSSAYQPYPGYRPEAGAIGEYNGKFMSNQWVLRGGCHLTPNAHLRFSYRNFFYPDDRWITAGIRLARDVETARNVEVAQ